MNKIVKTFLVLSGVGFLLFAGYVILMMAAFGRFDEDYSLTDLMENFNKYEKNLYDVKDYFNSITKGSVRVHVEFESNTDLAIFHVIKNNNYNSNWHISVNSKKADSLYREIGWTTENIEILKEKLDKANCLSVDNEAGNLRIGFQRSGMGMYFFNLFDYPVPDSLRQYYSDSCTYIIYREDVVFEYGGGVIGPQCFYNLE